MNQQCKVCGEPAAGFHFGAFTCEGCKSFFGRSYSNLSSVTECKNNGECVINKKNRTACKSCRLRKCLLVGMSKSGSRYGRRSNWFKIHCLLQEQQQAAAAQLGKNISPGPCDNLGLLSPLGYPHPSLNPFLRPEKSSSPSISSPESDSSEPSCLTPNKRKPETPPYLADMYLNLPFHSMFMPHTTSPFLIPPSLLHYPMSRTPPTTVTKLEPNNNHQDTKSKSKKFYLESILGLNKTEDESKNEDQNCPMDLSVKKTDDDEEIQISEDEEIDEEIDVEVDEEVEDSTKKYEQIKTIPLDLSA